MTAGPWSCPGPAGERLAMLAAALRAGAAGLYCAEAGAELMIGQQSWLCRSDFTGSFISLTPGLAGQAAVAVVGWAATVASLDGGALPCSGERRMLHPAASIAGGGPADLGETLTGLDRASNAAAPGLSCTLAGTGAPPSPCRRTSRLTCGRGCER